MTEDQLRKYIRNVILKDVAFARSVDKKSKPMLRSEFANFRYWRFSKLRFKKHGVSDGEPVISLAFDVDGVVNVHAEIGSRIGVRPVLNVVQYRVKGKYTARVTIVKHNKRQKRLAVIESAVKGPRPKKKVGNRKYYTKNFASNADKLVLGLNEAIDDKLELRGKQELIAEASN